MGRLAKHLIYSGLLISVFSCASYKHGDFGKQKFTRLKKMDSFVGEEQLEETKSFSGKVETEESEIEHEVVFQEINHADQELQPSGLKPQNISFNSQQENYVGPLESEWLVVPSDFRSSEKTRRDKREKTASSSAFGIFWGIIIVILGVIFMIWEDVLFFLDEVAAYPLGGALILGGAALIFFNVRWLIITKESRTKDEMHRFYRFLAVLGLILSGVCLLFGINLIGNPFSVLEGIILLIAGATLLFAIIWGLVKDKKDRARPKILEIVLMSFSFVAILIALLLVFVI